MNPSIFREYDIRGLAEQDFDKQFALLLARCMARSSPKKAATGSPWGVIAVQPLILRRSRHCRPGVDGVAGLRYRYLSRRCFIFLCFIDVDGGIEVTASHNPSEYNGFKLCIGKDTLYGQQIQDVRVKMERSEFQEKAGGKLSAMRSFPLSQPFIAGCAKIKTAIEGCGRCGQWVRTRGAATFFAS